MKISVFGLGYVGSVSCGCFCNEGHEVIGVDIDEFKVGKIRKGTSPVSEPGLNQLIRAGVENGRLTATTDVKEALQQTEISLICVGTPSNENGSTDLTNVKRVTEEIAGILAALKKKHILVYRCTILPGTFEKELYPIVYYKNNISPQHVPLVYNPEFMREGHAIHDFYHPAKTVFGVAEGQGKIAEKLFQLYNFADSEKIIADISSAQMLKYADNIFHALKVTFANEIGLACRSLGIDSHKLMEIFCKDKILNLGEYYLTPGKPFGGSCLSKDIQAFCNMSNNFDFSPTLINSIEKSNSIQKKFITTWIRSFGRRNVGFIGLTFKANTDDLRNSPAVEIGRLLCAGKYQVCVYDPNLNPENLIGSNLQFLYSRLPNINDMLFNDLHAFSKRVDLFVIFNHYPEINNWLKEIDSDKIILDLVRVGKEYEHKKNYFGLYW